MQSGLHPADAVDTARVCHEANRVLQAYFGDPVSPNWDDATQETRNSAIKGVQAVYDNPEITSAEQHKLWMDHKLSEGWVLGEVKDEEAKTHPNLIPYGDLPASQQLKDKMFHAIVNAALLM